MEGEHDVWNRKISSLANKYYVITLVPISWTHYKGCEQSHSSDHQRYQADSAYEDVLQYVEREEYHSVSSCACRHRHNVDPNVETCKHDTETCLHFGKLGYYMFQQGMGRQITRDETLVILKRAADAGLVHGISNSKKAWIRSANCCSCCCLFLEPVRCPSSCAASTSVPIIWFDMMLKHAKRAAFAKNAVLSTPSN